MSRLVGLTPGLVVTEATVAADRPLAETGASFCSSNLTRISHSNKTNRIYTSLQYE